VGDRVKGLTEIQIDDIYSSSLVHFRLEDSILLSGTFSKGIRTNLKSPDGRWPGTCGLSTDQMRPFSKNSRAIPHIPRKVEGRLLRRRAHLPAAICSLCAESQSSTWALGTAMILGT